ncbi:MAG: DUF4238 domain-containing protein [Actinobacteria bacterium]|nr:DUF4238 domain-containing protein [Actinomycetota bacterium]
MADLEARASAEAIRLYESMKPSGGVGSRHHTVPKFVLDRFAVDEQVRVRDLLTKGARTANTADLSYRDFYTVVTDDAGAHVLDGRLEQLLSKVEGATATVLRHVDAAPTVEMNGDNRAQLAQFLSFQMVRGVRQRMEIELMGEYYAKTMLSRGGVDAETARRASIRAARGRGKTPSRGNGGWKPKPVDKRLSDSALRGLRIRPHPNEHLAMIGKLSEVLFPYLLNRPVTVVDLDQPLLLIGDEPVLVFNGAERNHQPECFKSDEERDAALRRAVKKGRPTRELIHIYPTRQTGLEVASHIVLPISPSRALRLGQLNGEAPPHQLLTGSAASDFGDEVNELTLQTAYVWVAARPDHPTIDTLEVPGRAPVLQICDRSSAATASLAEPSGMPQRLRKGSAKGS